MTVAETLEFANAMAALNCLHFGARGGMATAAEALGLIEGARAGRVERRSHPKFASAGQRA
jgi:hypothetical protein